MPLSPYIHRLRAAVGHDLLLVPSVAVLPFDDAGRLLLVRQADHHTWATIGGSIEVDEAPEVSAVREAQEEAGVQVELTGLLAVLGGPGHRIIYPNRDQTAYVSAVYRARVTAGRPQPDGEETTEARWFKPQELASLDDLGEFARLTLSQLGLLGTLRELGLLGASSRRPRPGPEMLTRVGRRLRRWGAAMNRRLRCAQRCVEGVGRGDGRTPSRRGGCEPPRERRRLAGRPASRAASCRDSLTQPWRPHARLPLSPISTSS